MNLNDTTRINDIVSIGEVLEIIKEIIEIQTEENKAKNGRMDFSTQTNTRALVERE